MTSPSLQNLIGRILARVSPLFGSRQKTEIQGGASVQSIEEQTRYSEGNRSTVQILQQYVADLVLRGGAQPALLSLRGVDLSSSDLYLAHLWLKVLTDTVDVFGGFRGTVYHKTLLENTREQIEALKSQPSGVSQREQSQLKELERIVLHELSLLKELFVEQILRVTKVASSYGTFTFSMIEKTSLMSPIFMGMNTVIYVLNAALCGLFLYQARKNFRAVEERAQAFTKWVTSHIPSITPPDLDHPDRTGVVDSLRARLEEHKKRREKQIERIRNQPTSPAGERSPEEYVDRQFVIGSLVKNALIQMVQKKQQVEMEVLKVKKQQAAIRFSVAVIACAVMATVAVFALASNPLGAAALILTLLTAASIAINLGVLAGGYYAADQQTLGLTPLAFYAIHIRLLTYPVLANIASLKGRVSHYSRQKWNAAHEWISNRIREMSCIARLRKHPPNEVELQDLSREDREVPSIQNEGDDGNFWENRRIALQKELDTLAWKDFAKRAGLKYDPGGEFDTLRALSESIGEADLELIPRETQELFKQHLGIDLQELKNKMNSDSSAVERHLKYVFNLSDAEYIKFLFQPTYLDFCATGRNTRLSHKQ